MGNCALKRKRLVPVITRGHFASHSDRGLVRLHNEDRAEVLVNQKGDLLFVVCDGLGGHNKGDYASKIAVDVLLNAFARNVGFFSSYNIKHFFGKTIKSINKAIFEESIMSADLSNMSTTLNAVLLTNNKMYSINVGDSRFYTFSNNKLTQVSEDQTVVGYLVKTGQISKQEALTHPKRHLLTNALGTMPSVSFDFKKLKYHNETLLLCSDGLYNMLDDQDIIDVLATKKQTKEKVDDLIALANYRGGADNISVTLWEIEND